MIIRKGRRRSTASHAPGALVAETISHVGERIEPGITTLELDRIADEFIRAHGGVPTSQGYKGYPRAICISVDDVVVHGIPDGDGRRGRQPRDDRRRRDARRSDRRQRVHVRRRLGRRRVAASARRLPGRARGGDRRGAARQPDRRHLARRSRSSSRAPGFSVVKSLVGHGVGRHYHEDPHVPNFGEAGRGPRLSEGMTIAIEPMITVGGPEVWLAEDGWTIATRTARARPTSSTPSRSSRTARGSSRRASASPSNARALPRSGVGARLSGASPEACGDDGLLQCAARAEAFGCARISS